MFSDTNSAISVGRSAGSGGQMRSARGRHRGRGKCLAPRLHNGAEHQPHDRRTEFRNAIVRSTPRVDTSEAATRRLISAAQASPFVFASINHPVLLLFQNERSARTTLRILATGVLAANAHRSTDLRTTRANGRTHYARRTLIYINKLLF